ncbi:unnamed protein product [Schistosoma mattheei]|uniref:Uncharacterized protein n=1 Tax=Schistosoma mattheei TaxID=31246 RepID=A0A183NGD8_9TREM|nr:unnamed protein product [Schistosoma mattheei]
MVKSLSNRSASANRSNFGSGIDKNSLDKPENHPCQNGCVLIKSIRQVYCGRSD